MTKAHNMSAEIRVIKFSRCDNGNEQMGYHTYIQTEEIGMTMVFTFM